MKKRFLMVLFIIVTVLVFIPTITSTATISDFQLKDFLAIVTPLRDKTEVEMTWYTDEEMTSLKIEVLLDDGTTEHPVIWGFGPESKHNPNWNPPQGPSADGKYYYHLTLVVESGKFGIIYLDWQYNINSQEYTHPVYITTGNPNVVAEDYSPTAAIIIGIVATIGAALGTYLIYLISQKEFFNDEEEEENEVS